MEINTLKKNVLFLLFVLSLVFSCQKHAVAISTSIDEDISTPLRRALLDPYFPEKKTELFGLLLEHFSTDWKTACVYTFNLLTKEQRDFYYSLRPAGDGELGISFTRDLNNNGYFESVHYGAYEKKTGQVGNFLIVLEYQTKTPTILLLCEIPSEAPRFSNLTLKSNNEIFFGGGLVDSEADYSLSWEKGFPVIINLSSGE